MHVELVDFITIATRDKGAGGRLVPRRPRAARERGYGGEVKGPNVTFSFWEPESENLPFVANEAGVALRVADVEAARAELQAQGVQFIAETWDSGVCHFVAFRDPDGNVLILHRRYAPRTTR